jgi:diguanylate cyclase (GGDEF)-like protein
MDVLSLDPDQQAAVAGGQESETVLPVVSGRGTELLAEIVRHAPGGSSTPAQVRRGSLLAYTAASILLGLGLLAWTTSTIGVDGAIDPRLPGSAVNGSLGGLILWVMFGLLGSLRVLRAPGGGAFFTFVGAAMVLGGPTAGAWVAFLSTIERRELESQPWYGILANHSVMVVAAIAGGLTTTAVSGLLGGSSFTTGAGFASAVAGILVLTGVTTGMAAITVVLRDELSPRALLDLLVSQFGRITAIEVGLAWVLGLAYTETGWWAPLVIGGFVLLAWDNHPMPAPDPLTSLQSAEGFGRRMENGLGRMRRGLTPGATMLSIDLDYFKNVNDRYGHAVGDEVLEAIGAQLRQQARRPIDLAGRLGGDEFALFLPGLADADTAMRRAEEVWAAVTAPIPTSAGPVSVGASIGVLVLQSWGGVPSTGTVLRHADEAAYHAKRAGGGTHLFDPAEPKPFEDRWADGRR